MDIESGQDVVKVDTQEVEALQDEVFVRSV